MAHIKLQVNTIVQFGSLIGVVIGELTNTCGTVYNIDCAEQGVKTAKHAELTILNKNYVNTNMRVSQFLPQIINRYEQIKSRNQAFVIDYGKVIDAKVANAYQNYVKIADNGINDKSNYAATLSISLYGEIKGLKPPLKSQTFHFGGLYLTDIHEIIVQQLRDDNNVVRPFLYVNNKLQTDIQFGQLCQLVNQEFAGMKINEFTIKIGTAIGYTQTLHDVLAAYKEMQS